MTEKTPTGSDRTGPSSRTKTVSWDDPLQIAATARTMSGIEFMRAVVEGRVPPPPIARLLGFSLVGVEVGTATFKAEPDESSYNTIGSVHGGYACALLDSALGCAVHTTLPAGQAYTSLDITVNYLRPIAAGGTLTAVGRVSKPGSRAAFAEGAVRDEAGKLVATASSTLLVFPT